MPPRARVPIEGRVQTPLRNVLPLAPLLTLALGLSSPASMAQLQGVPPFELERLSLNPSGAGSLLLGTGELLPDGAWRLSLTAHHENEPLVLFHDGVRVGSVVAHRNTAHLSAAYGLKDRLELGVQLPMLILQGGDDLSPRGITRPREGLALGTPLLTARVMLLSVPRGDLVDMSLGVMVGPPVGSASALARELRGAPSLMVGRQFDSLRLAFDAGFMMRSRTVLSPDADIQDEIGHALRLGALVASRGEGLRGEATLIASVPLKREGHSIEGLLGARYPLSPAVEAYALAGLGFGSAPGTPDYRLLLGVAYGSAPPRCVAGGRHAPQECPELDDDADGVVNRDDACPLEGGHVDERGCPLRDSDGDTVYDVEDRCPTVPGLPELQGCPPRDSDGDGLLDEEDACPTVPGPRERRGCPPSDRDQDTVLDEVDNCPDEPGPPANHGCPEDEPQMVQLQTDRVVIKDKVYFDYNKATIQPRSFHMLDQVARVLNSHPEILLVSIEGHTDSDGSNAYNLSLSQRRAEAVRSYLSQKVAPERLEARGYGEERPIDTNLTSAGRANNRRVEFIILRTEHDAQQAP
jgi:outer membrane protein OmpA-like peptidoglycan-associated protein